MRNNGQSVVFAFFILCIFILPSPPYVCGQDDYIIYRVVKDEQGVQQIKKEHSEGFIINEDELTTDTHEREYFKSSAVKIADLSFFARCSPDSDSYFTFYRTYYKENEFVTMWASFAPITEWGDNLTGKTLTVRCTLTSGIKVLGKWTLTHVIEEGDNTVGLGIGMYVFEKFKNDIKKGKAKFAVSLSIPKVIQTSKSTTLTFTNEDFNDIPLPSAERYSQKESEWGKDCLGDCITKRGRCIYTMSTDGCATTSKAFIFNCFGRHLKPGDLNDFLRQSGGYDLFAGCHSGCPKDARNLLGAPSDVLWEGYYVFNEETKKRIYNFLESGFPVLLNTKLNEQHFVVAVGKQASGNLNIFDPLDGQCHRMQDRSLSFSKIKSAYFFSQW